MGIYSKGRLSTIFGAMLLIVPMLSFQGSGVKTAEAVGECRTLSVNVDRIIVSDIQDGLYSDDWHMELYLYDDTAQTHPVVWGGDAEYLEDFKVFGNNAKDFRNIGRFGPTRINATNILHASLTIPPGGGGLNVFIQGFETDFGAFRDGVGIFSKRFAPSANFGIGTHKSESSSNNGYSLDYTITCLNHAPVANTGGPYTGIRGFPVPFDGSQSADPDGRTVSYDWDFGDGTSGSGIKPIHTYNQEGTYQVILGVRDEHGETSTSSTTATVQRDAPTDFTVKCQQDLIIIFAGGENRQTPCTVTSINGFAGTVDLRCEAPTNPLITCSFSPSQVTPPANGSIDSTLTVAADFNSRLDTYDLKITATSEGRTFTITMRAEVRPL
jgi:hypothetical protein